MQRFNKSNLLTPISKPELSAFDHVIANPPFFPIASSIESASLSHYLAKNEGAADLSSWISFMLRKLKHKGILTMIHRADRLNEILSLLSGKAGAIGLTKALGKELADKDIAVNAVTPAGAKTRILDQMSKEHVQRMLSKVPRGRFLEIHEFTSLVCWLSSQENTFSTAAVFDISGGRSTY